MFFIDWRLLYNTMSQIPKHTHTIKRFPVKRLILMLSVVSSLGVSAAHPDVFKAFNAPKIEAAVQRVFEASPLHFILEDLMKEYEHTRGKMNEVNQLIHCVGQAEAEGEALISCDRAYQEKLAADEAAKKAEEKEKPSP